MEASVISRLSTRATGRLRAWGVDGAIAYSIVGRCWSLLAGPLTLILMVRCLTPEQQGYYATFTNLLGVTSVFELGISLVITQFAAHECARLEWQADGTLAGDDVAKARLASVLRLALAWYTAVASAVLAAVLPLGILFYGGGESAARVSWLGPWIVIATATAVVCLVSPIWAVLEGCGLVRDIAGLRLCQQLGGTLLVWLVLFFGGALWASPMAALFSLAAGGVWLLLRRRRLLWDLLRFHHGGHRVHWWTEFWPMQWRIALSTLGGYIVFQLPGPVLFRTHGAVTAGQWGLTCNIASLLGPIGSAWVNTKGPRFGVLIARRQWHELDALFFRALKQSTILVSAAGLATWMLFTAVWLYPLPWTARYVERMLPPLPFAALVANAVIMHVGFSMGMYLRAHKKEPYLGIAILNALCMLTVGLSLGYYFAGLGMAFGLLLGNATILLLGGGWIFIRKRREWHREEATPAATPVAVPSPAMTDSRPGDPL